MDLKTGLADRCLAFVIGLFQTAVALVGITDPLADFLRIIRHAQ